MRIPRVESSLRDDAVVVRVEEGFDIDITNASELADQLLESVPSSAHGMVLDLREVAYVDSAGVRLLFGLARQLSTSRQRLVLWLPDSSPVRRLVEITGLDQVVAVCPDEARCLDTVGRGD